MTQQVRGTDEKVVDPCPSGSFSHLKLKNFPNFFKKIFGLLTVHLPPVYCIYRRGIPTRHSPLTLRLQVPHKFLFFIHT